MMLKELVLAARSYRSFDESYTFTREMLLEYVDAARFCPSGRNLQPLKYRLVYEKEELDRLQPLTFWAAALPDWQLPPEGKRPRGFIVICRDARLAEVPGSANKDVGIAAETMLLLAAEKGLGGCMIGNYDPKKVQAALGLEECFVPELILALGKPCEQVVLTEAEESITYYRDAAGVHYVPKRPLEELVL